MKAAIFRSAEILLVRIAPGAIQLLSIIVVGRLLTPESYGVFSTGLASAAFFAVLVTGPIRFAIVPKRATYEVRGEAHSFERHTLFLLLIAAGAILVTGALAVLVEALNDASWIVLTVSSALYAGWLPILRARLQFWWYGVAALTNAVLLIALVYFFVAQQPSVSAAVWAFALSNAGGFLVGWLLCEAPLPRLPGRDVLRSILGVGSSFTVSNAAENGLYLGTRYTILWFGSAEFLGIFSFAVDIAQRSVGVAINIASFAIVPLSYKIAAGGDKGAFYTLLKRGMLLSAAASLVTFFVVIGLEFSGVLDWATKGKFSLIAFSLVSVAIIVNRLKKMVLDTVAVNVGAYLTIPVAYAVVVPIATGLSIFVTYIGSEHAILAIYPVAYILVAALTAWTVLRHVRADRAK